MKVYVVCSNAGIYAIFSTEKKALETVAMLKKIAGVQVRIEVHEMD